MLRRNTLSGSTHDLSILRRSQSKSSTTKLVDEDLSFSEILCTKNTILAARDFSLDPTTKQDMHHLVEKAIIFPNKTNFTLEELVEEMLVAIQEHKKQNVEAFFEEHEQFGTAMLNTNKSHNTSPEVSEWDIEQGVASADEEEVLDTTQEFTVEQAMNTIFVSETVSSLAYYIQKAMFNDEDGIYFDDSWLIMMCEMQSVSNRKVVICRMSYDMYIMPNCQAARIVILILANSQEKGSRGVLHTGNCFATLLAHSTFVKALIDATEKDEIVMLFKEKVDELQAQGIPQARETITAEEDPEFEFGMPFSGIKDGVLRRFQYYLDDFSDGLIGHRTLQKLLAAIALQYFATILPVIALGDSINTLTGGLISMKSVVYSQFFGSILYGIFSGNPMMMFQVSSVVLLYCNVLFIFAKNNNHDFHTLYNMTVCFSGIFVILGGIFNLSNLMIFNTSSVADMVDVFQSITYAQSVISDVLNVRGAYACQPGSKDSCDPGKYVLYILLLFLTVSIAFLIRSICGTRIFTAPIREFISDMAIPAGVIAVTVINIIFFHDFIELDNFRYRQESEAFQLIKFDKIDMMTASYSFVLAIPLSMLIFLDHNLNMEFLVDPNNKLFKGCAIHFDMLVIGIINSVFGLIGMAPMQGMFPNTPLHIKQMADIEITYDQDMPIKTLIRVRDTRLTQLIVGILVGISTFLLPLPIGYFPRASLNGLLLFIGYVSMEGNQLIDRIRLFFTDQTSFPSHHPLRRIPKSVAHKFTLIQIGELVIISVVSFSSYYFLTILFPIFLGLLIPVRLMIIPKFFSSKYLDLLDPKKD